jgi:hypothetical protein
MQPAVIHQTIRFWNSKNYVKIIACHLSDSNVIRRFAYIVSAYKDLLRKIIQKVRNVHEHDLMINLKEFCFILVESYFLNLQLEIFFTWMVKCLVKNSNKIIKFKILFEHFFF